MPDAIPAMRAMRQKATNGALISLSAADPLNLLGIVTPGERLAALSANRFLLRDGVPVAVHAAGEVNFPGEAGVAGRMGGAQRAAQARRFDRRVSE